MSKIQDVCVSFWLASRSLSYYQRSWRKIIDHRKLGEHLAELLESRAGVKEKNVHEGLGCHRRVKLQQRESGTGQTFRCGRSCQSSLANISICVLTVASAIHGLIEQMNHPLLGQSELSVGCPSWLVWLVCFANHSIVHYNLFFLGLLHSLTSVPIYKCSHLWPFQKSQSDISSNLNWDLIIPLSVPQWLSNDLGITPHGQNILCHCQQFKYHPTSLPLRC